MKKSELIFNIVSIPVDGIMLLLAGVVSFYLRKFGIDIVGPILYKLELKEFLYAAYTIIPGVLLIFAILGLYNLKGTRKFTKEFGRVIVGVSLGLLIVMLLFFFDQTIFPSRFIILATWGLGIILVIFGRASLKLFQKFLFESGIGLHKMVVVKGDVTDSELIGKFYKNKSRGYIVTSELEYNSGIFIELEGLFLNSEIDEILQANSNLSDEENLKLVEFVRNKGLEFSFIPNLFEVQRNIVETSSLAGLPIISLKNTPLDGWGKVVKRTTDVILSSLCLILTSPLFIIIAFAIAIDSRGKIIYSAKRGGKGKDFKFYKFRTMYSHLSIGENYGGEKAEEVRKELWKKNDRGGEQSPFLKIKDDPRVTKVGKFLRKTKLDEIPQFWNVLIGDMSMVGPRAHVLDEVGRYRNSYRRMFSIKPGIFGFSQISQASVPDLPFEEEIKLNTFYIENWSFWMDIKILLKSFVLLFFSKKPKLDY